MKTRVLCKWMAPCFVAAILCLAPGGQAVSLSDRGALWHVVKDLCLPMQDNFGFPFPCLKADPKDGFVVLRAPLDKTRILIVPTVRIAGIESPQLLEDNTPNYWLFAWNERKRVIPKPARVLNWDDIGMAINSQVRRDQNQLHIHVDCIGATLKKALAAHASTSSAKWSGLDLPWIGEFQVRTLSEDGLDQNIFKLVADEVPGARSRMAIQTIAIAGLLGPNGEHRFALLVNSDGGHAESVLDHTCAPTT